MTGLPSTIQRLRCGEFDLGVHVDLKGEDYVIGIERVAVGKFQSLTQLQFISEAVGGNLPGSRQRRLGFQGCAVDVYEVRHQAVHNIPGRRVGGKNRVQRFGLGTFAIDKPAACPSGKFWHHQNIAGRESRRSRYHNRS